MINKLFKLYFDYLLDNMSESSAKSYISYLRNSLKKFPCSSAETNFDLINKSIDTQQVSGLVEQVITKIDEELNSLVSIHNKKTLFNYKSSLNMLNSFLESNGLSLFPSKPNTVSYNTKSIHSSYTKNDLIKNFKARLNTQDRFYDFGALPCRLLRKIFKKNKTYNYLILNLIYNTKFYVNEKYYFKLNEIDKLIISDGHAYIQIKNEIYSVYTEVYIKGNSFGFEIAEVISTASLSLDHDAPIFEVLKSNINSYTELLKISSQLNRLKSINNLSISKLTTKFFNEVYHTLLIDETKLFNEIQDLYNKLSLTIMQTNYNSSKNKY